MLFVFRFSVEQRKRSQLEMFVLVFRLACRDSEDCTGNENLIMREKIFNWKF